MKAKHFIKGWSLTDEHALLVTLLVASTYMYVESDSFARDAGTFPRVFAGVVMVGTIVLLLRNFFPAPLQPFVSDTSAMGDIAREERKARAQRASDEPEVDGLDRPLSERQFTTVAILGYVGLSAAIGLLWAGPVFVAVYTVWFRKPWYVVVVLVILAYLIGYGFSSALNLDLTRGFQWM